MGAALGVRHVQGLFLEPVTIDRGWTREAFGFALALQNLLWGLAQPLTGMIADRFGSAKVIAAGALVYAAGLVLMAQAASLSLYTLGTGVLVGVALSGTAFGTVYGALSRMFPAESRGRALGLAGALGGFGQFCTVPFAQGLLASAGWIPALLVLAATMAVLAPLAVCLRDTSIERGAATAAQQQTLSAALGEALVHRGFWLLNAGFFVCGFQLAFISAHLPAYLMDKGLSPHDAGMALALVALANVAGTYLCGHAGGLWRRKYLLSAIYFTRAAATALFVLLPLTPLSACVYAFAMGLIWLGTVPLTTGIVSQVFGVRYIATLFGFVFLAHQVGSFFGVWLGGLVYDAMHSYDLLWYGSIALGIVAGVLHLPIDDKARTPFAQPA
jgi:MFS family permease